MHRLAEADRLLGLRQVIELDLRRADGAGLKECRNALEMRKVRTENLFLKRELKKGHEEKTIIGSSEEMVRVFKMD